MHATLTALHLFPGHMAAMEMFTGQLRAADAAQGVDWLREQLDAIARDDSTGASGGAGYTTCAVVPAARKVQPGHRP